jgi:hypothetical protein
VRGGAALLILALFGISERRRLDFHLAHSAEDPIRGFVMRAHERQLHADQPVRAVMAAPATKVDSVFRVAGDRQRVIRTVVPRTARFPLVGPDPARIEPVFPKARDEIGYNMARHGFAHRKIGRWKRPTIAVMIVQFESLLENKR